MATENWTIPQMPRTRTRLDLHHFLIEVIGNENVYFQPPASVKMKYPAIVYKFSNIQKVHADNLGYLTSTSYQITVIDRDPESESAKRIECLPYCSWNRSFTSDNLNHFVYTLYF